MTPDEAIAAIVVGIEQGFDAASGVDMIGLGEMGIGNSTGRRRHHRRAHRLATCCRDGARNRCRR